MVVLPKVNRSLRICVDFRCVNTIAKLDAFLIPHIEELLEQLASPIIDLSYFHHRPIQKLLANPDA